MGKRLRRPAHRPRRKDHHQWRGEGGQWERRGGGGQWERRGVQGAGGGYLSGVPWWRRGSAAAQWGGALGAWVCQGKAPPPAPPWLAAGSCPRPPPLPLPLPPPLRLLPLPLDAAAAPTAASAAPLLRQLPGRWQPGRGGVRRPHRPRRRRLSAAVAPLPGEETFKGEQGGGELVGRSVKVALVATGGNGGCARGGG